ncbi:MAG: thioesterase family protein [Candidatus Nanopelagicaceae bacterium]
MIHHTTLQARWADLDAFGHVNNAAYLVLVQEARADFTWYSRKLLGQKPILADMVVARAEVDFLEPIYEGGIEVDVAITVARLGNSSFALNYVISHQGLIHARANTVQVAVSMETKKSRPLTEEERSFLSDYLEVSAEG